MARRYIKEESIVRAVTSNNLGLEKPLVNEYYDIEVHNRNMDKLDSAIYNLKGKISDLELAIEDIVNVLNHGIEKGLLVDIQENTRKLQQLIDECENGKVIYFPAGVYAFNKINLGTKNNITFRGASSSFASFINKDINTGEITDTFTRIVCCAGEGETFFEHNNCVVVLDKIGFYNYYDLLGVRYGTGAKKNVFMSTTLTNKEKGKVFATECGFFGFKVVFGDKYTFAHLEEELGTELEEPKSFLQCCVLANRCRFTQNGIGISQNVDGRIVDCSFNKNNYAMVLRASSGFTTVSNCRIEWNLQSGIYIDGGHDLTIVGNEFDRNGGAGLSIHNAKNSTFDNNIFRRNGADETYGRENYDQNVHVVMKNSANCIMRGCSTISKSIMDTSSGGATRPSNCSNFSNNKECIISNNMLVGCTKSNKLEANKIEDNTDCVVSNNIPNL